MSGVLLYFFELHIDLVEKSEYLRQKLVERSQTCLRLLDSNERCKYLGIVEDHYWLHILNQDRHCSSY